MNWFAQKRQEWIAETLHIYGFVNRAHLMRKFGISGNQAANDFNTFNDTNPKVMQYDNRKKIYVATKPPKAVIEVR